MDICIQIGKGYVIDDAGLRYKGLCIYAECLLERKFLRLGTLVLLLKYVERRGMMHSLG